MRLSARPYSYLLHTTLVLLPFLAIILMYSAMITTIVSKRLSCKRIFVVTTLVVITGLLSYLPSILTGLVGLRMGYKGMQVLTVTVFYANSLSNPVIYLASHPSITQYLRRQ